MLLDLFENSLFALILVGILFVCAVALCVYYFQLLKIKSFRQSSGSSNEEPISVVIATRDEHDQLRQNLPFFLQQNYANFEVVVVIDDSDEKLSYVMRELEKQYSNLKVVRFEWSKNFFVNYRFAESIGIKSATYDRILLSDIATRPASPEWIAQMSKTLSGNKKIVIGYHTIASKPSFTNAFIRYNTFSYVLYYLRAVLSGNPFTADSKNIAFERSLFYQTKGVTQFYSINTGNEDMFVNKAANKDNTTIEINPNAFVKGQLEPSFNEWFDKKIRHRIMLKEFKTRNKFGLKTYDILMALFYLTAASITGCFFLPNANFFHVPINVFMIATGIFWLKIFIQWIIFKQMLNVFKEHGFLLLIPIFEIMILFLSPFLWLTGLFTKRITWK